MRGPLLEGRLVYQCICEGFFGDGPSGYNGRLSQVVFQRPFPIVSSRFIFVTMLGGVINSLPFRNTGISSPEEYDRGLPISFDQFGKRCRIIFSCARLAGVSRPLAHKCGVYTPMSAGKRGDIGNFGRRVTILAVWRPLCLTGNIVRTPKSVETNS
jgi:hypothetical protein